MLSTMRKAVFLAALINLVCELYMHHIGKHMFDDVWKDEGYLQWQQTLNATRSRTMNTTPGLPTIGSGNNTDAFNYTMGLHNATSQNGMPEVLDTPNKSFYSRQLPRHMVVNIAICMLEYWWFVWLEKMLPARPRQKATEYQPVVQVEENEDREEEIVKKWIIQGKVRRASLNWCNTLLKLLLQMTVGRVLQFRLTGVLSSLLKWEVPKVILGNMEKNFIEPVVFGNLSPTTLIELIALVAIPAHQQMVFITGIQAVVEIFFTMAGSIIAKAAIKSDYAQNAMRNATRSAIEREEFEVFKQGQALKQEL